MAILSPPYGDGTGDGAPGPPLNTLFGLFRTQNTLGLEGVERLDATVAGAASKMKKL